MAAFGSHRKSDRTHFGFGVQCSRMEKSPDKTAIRRTDSGDIESTDKMATIQYREAQHGDIAAMAEIRAGDWGTQEQWSKTIRQYIDCEHHPREAWLLRACFVCVTGDQIVGLIAGHLTRRFDCDGELQWISVRPEYRKRGIAAQLLKRLAAW